MLTAPHPDETATRLLARLVREVLRTEGPFESLADLTAALKTRCARLRIGWTNEAISAAYQLIQSNTDLVAEPLPLVSPTPDPRPPLSRAEASAILQRLRTPAPQMPSARLGRYVNEFTFRLNEGNVARRTIARIDSFIAGVAGKRLTYQALIQ